MHGPKKALGQHFLKNKTYAQKIVDALDSEPGDSVLEIGPGRGVLTTIIIQRFPADEISLYVVEKDRTLIEGLKRQFQGAWYHVIHDDILQYDLKHGISTPGKKLKVLVLLLKSLEDCVTLILKTTSTL